MKYTVSHTTEFEYDRPVISSHQVLRLTPRNMPGRQALTTHNIEISEPGAEINSHTDYFGNTVHEVVLNNRHERLSIHCRCLVDVQPKEELLLELSPNWQEVVEQLRTPQSTQLWEAAQFCYASPHVDPKPAFDLARELAEPGTPLLRLAHDVSHYIYRNFDYEGGVTTVSSSVGDVLANRHGVCQDFAHVGIAALRALGLAARYVSGYILSNPIGGSALVGAEASHAWISVYCPEFGWVDFDPTNNLLTSDQHITLGWGRDYADVAPTRGSILGGGDQRLAVQVEVRPVDNGEYA